MNINLYKPIYMRTYAALYLVLSSFCASGALTSTTVTISGNVVPRTCAFEEEMQQVILPDIMTSDINGQSDVAGRTDFSINIRSCHLSVKALNLYFSGESEPGTFDILHKNTGTSKNVGLRLAFSDDDETVSPIADVTSRKIQISNGEGSINLKAEYARTSAQSIAGSFSATVMVKLEYP